VVVASLSEQQAFLGGCVKSVRISRPFKKLRGGTAAQRVQLPDGEPPPGDDPEAGSDALKVIAELPESIRPEAGEFKGKFNYTKKRAGATGSIQVQSGT